MSRKTLQFISLVVFVLMVTVASQAETHAPTIRGNSQEVQQTVKNILSEIKAARAKLTKAREGYDLFTLTFTRKNIPAIEKQMAILSRLVRSGSSDLQTKLLAVALQKFENLKISAKANQRNISLKRLYEFEQSIKAMGGVVPSRISTPTSR